MWSELLEPAPTTVSKLLRRIDVNIDNTESPVRELLSEEVASVSGGHSFFTFEIAEWLGALIGGGLSQIEDTSLLGIAPVLSSDSVEREARPDLTSSITGSVNIDDAIQDTTLDLGSSLADFPQRPFELEDQITG